MGSVLMVRGLQAWIPIPRSSCPPLNNDCPPPNSDCPPLNSDWPPPPPSILCPLLNEGGMLLGANMVSWRLDLPKRLVWRGWVGGRVGLGLGAGFLNLGSC